MNGEENVKADAEVKAPEALSGTQVPEGAKMPGIDTNTGKPVGDINVGKAAPEPQAEVAGTKAPSEPAPKKKWTPPPHISTLQ